MGPAAVAAVGCTIWLAAFLAAQQSSQPTFRGGVELVEFDVTVLDRHRNRSKASPRPTSPCAEQFGSGPD